MEDKIFAIISEQANKGISHNNIANFLNSKNLKTSRMINDWSRKSISNFLNNRKRRPKKLQAQIVINTPVIEQKNHPIMTKLIQICFDEFKNDFSKMGICMLSLNDLNKSLKENTEE